MEVAVQEGWERAKSVKILALQGVCNMCNIYFLENIRCKEYIKHHHHLPHLLVFLGKVVVLAKFILHGFFSHL